MDKARAQRKRRARMLRHDGKFVEGSQGLAFGKTGTHPVRKVELPARQGKPRSTRSGKVSEPQVRQGIGPRIIPGRQADPAPARAPGQREASFGRQRNDLAKMPPGFGPGIVRRREWGRHSCRPHFSLRRRPSRFALPAAAARGSTPHSGRRGKVSGDAASPGAQGLSPTPGSAWAGPHGGSTRAIPRPRFSLRALPKCAIPPPPPGLGTAPWLSISEQSGMN